MADDYNSLKLTPCLYILIAMVMLACACTSLPAQVNPSPSADPSATAPVYTYKIINVFPHDRFAYTQGLAYDGGILYEGTGLNGKSSLRKVDLTSGKVLQIYQLPSQYWGEGITIYKGKIIQLTWKSHTGFIYDINNFELLQDFTYPTEGWGITALGDSLVMSDGTASLYFLDPDTLKTVKKIEVHDKQGPLGHINELENVNGKIFANIWGTDMIAIIDPASGNVSGWIDLTGLLATQSAANDAEVLNGIAFDGASVRLYVTGKLWPSLFEIELIRK